MDLNSDRNMKVKGQESQQLFTTTHRTSLECAFTVSKSQSTDKCMK